MPLGSSPPLSMNYMLRRSTAQISRQHLKDCTKMVSLSSNQSWESTMSISWMSKWAKKLTTYYSTTSSPLIREWIVGLISMIVSNRINISTANILQAPPLKDSEFLYNDVFFNPFVIQIMNAWATFLFFLLASRILLITFSYLGSKPIWNFLTGNNALPRTNGLRQPVHKDITFFHPQVSSPPALLLSSALLLLS